MLDSERNGWLLHENIVTLSAMTIPRAYVCAVLSVQFRGLDAYSPPILLGLCTPPPPVLFIYPVITFAPPIAGN